MIAPLLLAALAAAPAPLATVDGAPVTQEDLRERLRTSPQSRPEDLLEDLINDQLLAAEARRQNLQQTSEVREAVAAEKRRRAAALFDEQELGGAMRVDEAQLRELYHSGADSVRLSWITLASKDDAEKALARLKAGGKFSEEARHSLDFNTASSGGDLGWRSRSQLRPAIADLAFAAKLNEPAGPVQFDLGWALVLVQERQLGDEAGFAAKRESLRQFAAAQGRIQARAHALQQLRKRYGVALDEAFLRGTGERIDATTQEASHALAKVGDRALTYAEVLAEMRRLFGSQQGGHFSGTAVKTEMAWKLSDQLLLEQEALAHGYGDRPELAAPLARAEREALVRALAAKLRAAAPAPSDAEVSEYYKTHQPEFTHPASRACSHLLVATREQADILRKRAAKEPFEDLAREFSRDGSTAPSGGALGDLDDPTLDALSAGGEPALAKAFREAKPSEIGAPVQSRSGWHLVRCGPRRAPSVAPFAEVREGLTKLLAQRRQDDSVRLRIAELRRSARIDLDRAALEKARAQLTQ